MLTPEQLEAVQDQFELIAGPINEYIIRDIVNRILDAGEITSTARYKAKIAKELNVSLKEVKLYVKDQVKRRKADFEYIFNEVAKLIYEQNADNTSFRVIPFEQNEKLQNIVLAAVELADDNFKNITQTLGMVDPYGHALPLRDAYINCCDYAFKKVVTGADTYQNAVNEAVKNLAEKGVQTIDYESGRHDQLDVAIRRSVFGGMGLMVEQIEQQMHDEIGADGWEISAHEASAKDHEPIQGRQFTNEQYKNLNNSLQRRIGTLNCKHTAFPIIVGVSKPQYTEEQLKEMAQRNADGINYEGKHYTMYEATQMQRKIERAIRKERRKLVAYDQDPAFKYKFQTAQLRHNALENEYALFSKAAGLKTQMQRLDTLGFKLKMAR